MEYQIERINLYQKLIQSNLTTLWAPSGHTQKALRNHSDITREYAENNHLTGRAHPRS